MATNLEARGGPVWDHVFVCEKGHYIPFSNLHPAVKVSHCFMQIWIQSFFSFRFSR